MRPGCVFSRRGCYGQRVFRLLLTAFLLGSAVLATACGSQTNTYRSQVDTVEKQYQPRLKPLQMQLATAIGDRRTDDAADLAGQTAEVLRRCADAVAAVEPPSHLKTRAATLVAAYRKLVQSLQDLKTALHAHQATPINRAISRYNDARLDETSAVAALNSG
ncbi:MAG: hypothetical protein QOC86_3079 [Gaiellales bacterium]|nr:hypothetical protein [Gaiellales bacterium]